MVGLVMSYRLAPDFQHPEQVRDVAREFWKLRICQPDGLVSIDVRKQ